jgi:PRD1 phage membrane DNA delivery
MDRFMEMVVTIALGFMVVAGLALLISKNANTAGVLQASASGFGNVLDVAISPVTGATTAPNLSYPGGTGIGSSYGGFTPNQFGA